VSFFTNFSPFWRVFPLISPKSHELLAPIMFLAPLLLLASLLMLVVVLLLESLLLLVLPTVTNFLVVRSCCCCWGPWWMLLATLHVQYFCKHPCWSNYLLYCTVQRLSNYRNMDIGLLFFSAIGLSEYRISDWRILETIGLSDIGSRPQSIGLSNIGFKKTYRLPTSDCK
jgi:hypothetical protein